MSLIELKNVSKTFKGYTIFDDVSVAFEEGKCYGIMGPNGSGKSVLFKMMCQFVKPDVGEVSIDSRFLDSKARFPKDFGIIIDRPGYIPNKTGFENLKELASIKNDISDDKIEEVMRQVNLDPNLKQKMKNYSLGMKQKISIAQAIMEDQSVLILDEPFNGLDISGVETVRAILLGLKKRGKTIILTSHNKEDLDILCDAVFLIDQYKIIPRI
ncbi:ABC transporter ATP-binding protein [Listeria sp. FSL L7-1582]|uniref:ABC transporter ATP-binding protein n=1 Tax=Listeria portnoyi TaxID=2713504 RepID=UPI00164D2FE7|nr:ABC transporter ATP-binding protein [Listeria portnoyi]MBC6308860.1 ABC transporter ATP-binding protein [Listeria portnoyi]